MKIQKDKVLHFVVNVVATIISIILYEICPIVLILCLPVGLSLGKEYGDSKAVDNKWDWNDIVADYLGIYIVTIIYIIIKTLC